MIPIEQLIYITFLVVVVGSLGLYYALRSGHNYGEEDVDRDAQDYAGVIKESHGPLTRFLVLAYIILVLWAIVYIYLHSSEFFAY